MAFIKDEQNNYKIISDKINERTNHLIGLSSLLLFCGDNDINIDSPIIEFPLYVSNLLFLVMPKNNKYLKPVMAFESEFWNWFKYLAIEKILIKYDGIIFITKEVVGDTFSPTFNPILIKIPLLIDISFLNKDWKNLDLAPIFDNIPLMSLSKQISLSKEFHDRNYMESLYKKMEMLQNNSPEISANINLIKLEYNLKDNLAFKGTLPLVDLSFQKLIDDFNPKEVPLVDFFKYNDS